MMRIAFVLLALWAPSGARAQAGEATVTRAAIERRLLAFEGGLSAADAARWGAGGREILMALVRGDGALVLRRRATHALGLYPEPAVRELLTERARDPREDPMVARIAVGALADAFGAAVFGVIAALCSDARVQVRIGAARALARIDGERAGPLLSARRAVETHAAVRAELGALTSAEGEGAVEP